MPNTAAGGNLAIVSINNTHGAITAGQFVYVKSNSNVTEGLYTAKSSIAANAALSLSNLTAVSGGGLNSLKAGLDTLNSNMTQITTLNASFNVENLNSNSRIFAYKYMKMLFVDGYIRSQTEDIANGTVIASISDVSLKHQSFASPNGDLGSTTRLILKKDGSIATEKLLIAGEWFSFIFVALLN